MLGLHMAEIHFFRELPHCKDIQISTLALEHVKIAAHNLAFSFLGGGSGVAGSANVGLGFRVWGFGLGFRVFISRPQTLSPKPSSPNVA